MRKRRRILSMAALLLVIAVMEFFLINYMNTGKNEPVMIPIWRLFLACLLSLLLALGKNYARWLIVVGCALGSVSSLAAITILLMYGGLAGEYGPLILSWGIFVTIAYAFISVFLAYSRGVSREITRIAERIE